jgi:hypothetical protein
MTKHWAPLDHKPLHKIVRKDIAMVLNEIKSKRGPVAASRARDWLGISSSGACTRG